MGTLKRIPKYQQTAPTRTELQTQAIQTAFAIANKAKRSFKSILNYIIQNQLSPKEAILYGNHFACIAEKVQNHPSQKNKLKLLAYKDLLLHLDKTGCDKMLESTIYQNALFHVASRYAFYIRSLKTWKPRNYNPEKQFSCLIRHLFARYPMASFWDSAWHSDKEYERQWFIGAASGTSIRNLVTIIKMTKRMAHAFLQAPGYCNVSEALRYAQTLGFGGDERLAYFINRSRLGRNNFQDEEFWCTVIRFFAESSMFDAEQLDVIVDYLHEQRIRNRTFSMKGRTMASVFRQTMEWHEELNRFRNRGGTYIWKSSGLKEYILEEGKDETLRTYIITELLSSNELVQEGKTLHHCVGSYARSCHQGCCAIFSLRMNRWYMMTETLITIEVNLKTRQIVQARGK